MTAPQAAAIAESLPALRPEDGPPADIVIRALLEVSHE